MIESLNLPPETFQGMRSEVQIQAVQEAFGKACHEGGYSLQDEVICHFTAKPIAHYLSSLPETVQGNILMGLSPMQGLTLFRLLSSSKSPAQIAATLLSMPNHQACAALAQLARSTREPILNEIGHMSSPETTTFLTYWERFILDPGISSGLRSLDDTERVQAMTNGDLMKSVAENAADRTAIIEIIQRKRLSDVRGNGFHVPQTRKFYRDLAILSYVNRAGWVLCGSFFDQGRKQWLSFRYVANADKIFQQLWIGETMFFPSDEQADFFYEKGFSWATKAGRHVPEEERPTTQLWPSNFGTLKFERIDAPDYSSRQFPDPKIPLTLDNIRQNRIHFIEVKGDKPAWNYYFAGDGDRTAVIIWDEESDLIEIEIFMAANQAKDPQWSGKVDDARARSLLPLLEKIRPDNRDDRKKLRRLSKKLRAISDYR